MASVRVAIAGVGNCASSLVQGVAYYAIRDPEKTAGLMHGQIGPYAIADVEFVAAFDVDVRKVGLPLEQAIFAKPNRTPVFEPDLSAGGARRASGVRVEMGPVLDGVAEHMLNHPAEASFRVAAGEPVDVAARAAGFGCRRPRQLSAGRIRAGDASLCRGVSRGGCSPRELHSGLPRFGSGLGRALSRGRPSDRGGRREEPARSDDRPPGARPALRRPRCRARSDLSAEHGRQHGFPQHARAKPPRVEEALEDRIGPESARRSPRSLANPHRPLGLRRLAGRQQGRPSSAWRDMVSGGSRSSSSCGSR